MGREGERAGGWVIRSRKVGRITEMRCTRCDPLTKSRSLRYLGPISKCYVYPPSHGAELSEMLNIQGFEELFYGEGFIELFTLPGSRATEDVASSGLLLSVF